MSSISIAVVLCTPILVFCPETSAKDLPPQTDTHATLITEDVLHVFFDPEAHANGSRPAVTHSSFPAGETEDEDAQVPMWQTFMDGITIMLAVVGIVANLGSLLTLVIQGQRFSPAILTLLRHQSFTDFVACVMALALLVQPPMWATGSYGFDVFVCHGWHSQQFYWGLVFVSIWNLVLLSFERYLAVCRPFKHQDLTQHKLHIHIVAIYGFSFLCSGGCFFQARMEGDICVSEYYITRILTKTFFYWFSLSTFFTYYVFPCALFFVLYGMVIITFQKRQKSDLASSRVIDKATTELTKTAIVVTVIFIFTMAFDNWYYVLGNTGVTQYVMNSPLQKISMAMAAINSAANPFVYALLMPSYRRSVAQTFCAFAACPFGKASSDQRAAIIQSRQVQVNDANN